jgi:hypothetical protein
MIEDRTEADILQGAIRALRRRAVSRANLTAPPMSLRARPLPRQLVKTIAPNDAGPCLTAESQING